MIQAELSKDTLIMLGMNKFLPPFSRPLYDMFVGDSRPNKYVSVFVGLLAWQQAKAHSELYPERTLCIPPWYKPESFFFPVDGCKVLIIDTHPISTDMHYVRSIATQLLEDQAISVFFLYQLDTQSDLITFKKGNS
jgi:hypothetical protein